MIKNLSYVDLISSGGPSPTFDTRIIPLHVPYLIKLPSNRSIYTCIYQFKYDNWKEYYQSELSHLFDMAKQNTNILQNIEYNDFTLFCYNFSSKTKPSSYDVD